MEVQKEAGLHGSEAMGVCEAMGHGKGMIPAHPDPPSSVTSHGLLVMGAEALPETPVPLCLTVPIACLPTEEGNRGEEAGVKLELFDLEFTAGSCFIYYTHTYTHTHIIFPGIKARHFHKKVHFLS